MRLVLVRRVIIYLINNRFARILVDHFVFEWMATYFIVSLIVTVIKWEKCNHFTTGKSSNGK